MRRDLWISAFSRELIKKVLPAGWLHSFASKQLSKEKLEDDDIKELKYKFDEDIRKLEELTDIDFSKWISNV